MKKKILVFAGYYLPSVKGGGPIQSIKNMVDNLSEENEFYIVAADRDLGDDKPFYQVKIDEWIKIGRANVFYTDTGKLSLKKIIQLINCIDCQVLYLNSFFDYKLTTIPVILRKLNLIKPNKIIIAPRGQFSPGALGLKSFKKKLFINITKILNLYKGITWHATTAIEKGDFQLVFGNEIRVVVANNLTANYNNMTFDKVINKSAGELKLVFISRIHPKKNLMKAINLLLDLKGNIVFNIYGNIEDKDYWNECKRVINNLPVNIKVYYKGIVSHNEVINIFKKHHIFLFPTLGENYGHVISEAMIGGCPVIVSDQTPWINLEANGVGWDIGLSDTQRYKAVLESLINMDDKEYQQLAINAFNYAKDITKIDKNLKDYKKLFEI